MLFNYLLRVQNGLNPRIYAVCIRLVLTFGGMCMLPQLRGGACFCTRGAMPVYDVIYLFSRWQKP